MAKGRAQSGRGEAYWQRIVRQQAASGVTIRDFCRKAGLNDEVEFYRKSLEAISPAGQRWITPFSVGTITMFTQWPPTPTIFDS